MTYKLAPALVAVLTIAISAAPAAVGIDKLAAYEGSWSTHIEHYKTPYSRAGIDDSTLRNECWRSAGFYACNQFVNGESKALIVFTYNSKDDTYANYAINSSGGPANSGKLLIRENTWTYPWEDKDKDQTVYFQVVNVFTAPGQIQFTQEYSTDKVHWTVMAKGLEKKQP